jgi:hypothetical protein
VESNIRYYRRRANEELAAADRAVTAAARERRMQLAGLFLDRLNDLQLVGDPEPDRVARSRARGDRRRAFDWSEHSAAQSA